MATTSDLKTRLAKRSGIIHAFESDDQRRAFLKAHTKGINIPVLVRSGDGELTADQGRLVATRVDGKNLIGSIRWVADHETKAANSTPIAELEFNEDGSAKQLVIAWDDDEKISQTLPKSKPKVSSMAKNSLIDIDDEQDADTIFDRNISRYDDDSTKLAKVAIKESLKANAKIKDQEREIADLKAAQPAADHAVIPKADADLLAKYKELGEIKVIKSSLESLEKYKEIGDDPEVIKKAVEDGKTSVEKLALRDWEKQLDEVAEVEKITGSGKVVLKSLVKPTDVFEKTKVKDPKTNKDVDTFKIKRIGEDGKEVVKLFRELEESDDWKPYVPALRPDADSTKKVIDRPASRTGHRDDVVANRERDSSNANNNRRQSVELTPEEESRKAVLNLGMGM